jgi:hypothetical protein
MHTKVRLESLKGKRPVGRTRCRSEVNIKMDLRERMFGVWIVFICFRIVTVGKFLCK